MKQQLVEAILGGFGDFFFRICWSMMVLVEDTLPQTNSSLLKMDGWKMNFLLGNLIFGCKLAVNRECKFFQKMVHEFMSS